MGEESGLLTASEAARLLRVSTGRLYELCRMGTVPVVRLGRQIRLDRRGFRSSSLVADGGYKAMSATERSAGQTALMPVISGWRLLLRTVKAARGAAHLGSKAAASAAALELRLAERSLVLPARALLASQGAKGEFATDLRKLEQQLAEHDSLVVAMKSRPSRRGAGSRSYRPDRYLLPVEAARAVPLTSVLSRFGLELTRSGSGLVARCPFHQDGRPSLHVSVTKGLWYCFPCGIGGDGIAFVMRVRGVEFATAVREVAA